MFTEILKTSGELIRKNMNLTNLMFLFFIAITFLFPLMYGLKLDIKILLPVALMFAIFCAFFAGIFNAFKKSLEYSKEPQKLDEITELPPLYFAEFFQGIGEFFTKFLSGGVLILIILALFAVFCDYMVSHYMVLPKSFLAADWKTILSDENAMKNFYFALTNTEKLQLGKLYLFSTALLALFGYITMLYPVSLVKEEKNFLNCFWINLKVLFKNFPLSLLIYAVFNILLLMVSMINFSVAGSIILSVVAILLQCYLNVLYIMVVFVYYEKTK